ncbi:MAG TPA: S8 family serine peptidase, partial [Myxococcota bacterium]|nr:S8 family serine peptidase [Myxococcota bacterium]
LLYIAAQQVPVLTPNGSYVYGAGTSFAAPFVSGVVAYLLALDPENPQGKDREAQIARLKAALMDGAASIGGRKVLDAYASARRFLTDPATPKRIRGFDRLMCDCDDGTRHGNDRPAASGPDGSGSSPEWLEGDGRINMAELRAFRDAWLQCHVVFPRLTAAKPVEQTGAYALRLRDLAASGATPWDSTWDESDDTKKKSSYLLWNRFDFDGDGAIAREQPVESATLARLRSDPTLPMVAPGTGLELALLASLWPESLSEAGAELPWKTGKVYPSDYEFVPDPTRLPELLPSCDLRITAAALKQLTDALAKENAVLESVSFQWSRGEWDPAAKSFTATNMDLPPHRREANAADFGRWMDQPPGLLTLPLVELPKLSSFVPPDSTKNQCYQFVLTVLASGKGAGSYPFEAIVDAPRAIGGEGDKHGCIAALLGGRYSITGFSLDPNKKPKPPAAPEQPKATAEVGVTKGSGL